MTIACWSYSNLQARRCDAKCVHDALMRGPRHTRTTREEKKQGFSQKVIWPPLALRIGLLRSSAVQNDGRIKPVMLQCRTPRETNPKGHWGPNYFLRKSLFFFLPGGPGMSWVSELRRPPIHGVAFFGGAFSGWGSWLVRECRSGESNVPPAKRVQTRTMTIY